MLILKPLVALAACAALTVGLSAPDAQAKSTPGATGAGDPFFPLQGNGGYDVAHYGVAIAYQPSTRRLTGSTTVTATTTADLSQFDLDLRRSMVVSSVLVNGRRARFSQPAALKQELVITPARPLRRGQHFTVSIHYGGTPGPLHDPDGSLDGFIPTTDGAFIASEPQGSPTWFPVNDTPTDKASYDLALTVPAGLAAVSNGKLLSTMSSGGHSVWRWRMPTPISSYLVTASIGRFTVHTGKTASGIPYLNAVDPTQAAKTAPVLAKLPAIVDYFSAIYGRYPFTTTGAIVDNAPQAGYALETASRPLFDGAPDEATLSHELAHQWFGDSVTLTRWSDIWLNEGFAEFSSWFWDEHTGATSGAQHLQTVLAEPASSQIWTPPPAHPGSAAKIFGDSVYVRGAATLQALRGKLGDTVFFSILRGWAHEYRYRNATVAQFRSYAARVSHRDLSHFFAVWLDNPAKPTSW